ncbi:hypothetical protein BcepSauron_080 [Burkholderia phage BcepSauron]|uniref:Uncharacterized protein n=2 Tax=Sarumanvirus TaxID=2843450 RepID=A0A482MN02_9CAUD|nr:hypothetical protein H1O16_gp080 [Burkholderia phage BcepSaruman]YP_009904458.1 hypothetical protein H1O17_gp080 [Burkholderia phage BcepSauron]QBQ74460.1 hypothetical protein BcepSauron_080 [Burkholderia phage BcepSauron]QBX06493.1 hypothetical protein BcepSaruman_080 [Burkholderia phage BcepSaruman]
MASTTIEPIDYLVFAGFQQRFQQTFDCAKTAFVNSNDKAVVMERLFGKGNKNFSYPYAFFEVKKVSENTESYNPHNLMRRGMFVNVNSGSTVQTVRVIPTDFEIEITYVTNQFQSVEQGSVMAFARRWLLARRGGYLKSSVQYGRLKFGVGVTLDSSITTPSLGNVTETETAFGVVVSATIHGYSSEPVLGEIGVINTINVLNDDGIPVVHEPKLQAGERLGGTQFLAFPDRS